MASSNDPVITLYFTKNGILKSIDAILQKPDGTAVNLDNPAGQVITFRMVRETDSTIKIDGASVVIVTGSAGQVRFDWGANDLNTPGSYFAWFIQTSGGKSDYYPAGGRKLKIVVTDPV